MGVGCRVGSGWQIAEAKPQQGWFGEESVPIGIPFKTVFPVFRKLPRLPLW